MRPWAIQNLCIRDSKKVLKLKKYSLRYVQHTLNGDQKAAWAEIAASMLSIFEPLTAHAHSLV
jgi:hypothetical protein